MGRNGSSIAKRVGESAIRTAESPTKPTTLAESKTASSSPPVAHEPKTWPLIEQWLAEIIGQGAEAAHVFADTDDAKLFFQVEGGKPIEVGIGSRHFIVIEIPSCPMDGPGYRVYSRVLSKNNLVNLILL